MRPPVGLAAALLTTVGRHMLLAEGGPHDCVLSDDLQAVAPGLPRV